MPESFDDRDLSESSFWGVQLHRATFRDTDFSDSTFFHVFLKNVSIDGEINNLVINGVDVTEYVNQHDRWWPLRNNLSPTTKDGFVESWNTLSVEWRKMLENVSTAQPSVVHQSVNGEWSLSQTLRHLIFAMDKWFMLPIFGATSFTPIGLPNSSSQARPWPGLDLNKQPDFEEIVATRLNQHQKFHNFISEMLIQDLPEIVTIEENGGVPTLMCFHAVLEEEFEHLRYMLRDLAVK
jgi:hypothetical protein